MQPKLREGAKAVIQKRKRAFCFEMGRGYWEALPQARPPGLRRAGLGQQAPRGSRQTHACPCVILQHPAQTPAQLWRCSLLTGTVDAFLVLRTAQAAPVRGLQWPLPLASSALKEVAAPAAGICPVTLLLYSFLVKQPRPTHQFPGRPLFS